MTTSRPNQLLRRFLMSSYLYYELHQPILTDSEFDALCRELAACWGEVTEAHKSLITLDDLRAGTGYAIRYPALVVGAAHAWLKDPGFEPAKLSMPVQGDLFEGFL